MDYASYQDHLNQLEQASRLWSEEEPYSGPRCVVSVLQLDRLHVVDPAPAEKFVEVNSDLEPLTMSMVPNGRIGLDGGGEVSGGMDPFNHLVAKQRKLLEERDGLVLRILASPDLKNFIMTPFVTLHSAASHQSSSSTIRVTLPHPHSSPWLFPFSYHYNRWSLRPRNRIERLAGLVQTRQQHRLGSE